eukprot:1064716-Lingulodinium_polyedra.AAC.1
MPASLCRPGSLGQWGSSAPCPPIPGGRGNPQQPPAGACPCRSQRGALPRPCLYYMPASLCQPAGCT